MEIDALVIALEKTVALLQKSESSLYGSLSVEEVIRQLEEELDKRKKLLPVDIERLKFLFVPTASLQDIAIDNRWGEEFLEIAKIFS